MKIYCNKCKYFNCSYDEGINIEECSHPGHMTYTDTVYEETPIDPERTKREGWPGEPRKINANNDCQQFASVKRKQWKRRRWRYLEER